ncbi:MAG: pilus assembly protein PilM [Bacilli bacterium]|nr:pilus assembly protein PilM [Bacilli bacterium]
MKKIFTSVDIGSDTVKILTCEVINGQYNVLASTSIKSKGIRKGLVVDSSLAINTIKDGMKIINDDLGFEVKKVIVNIPDYNAKFMYITGEVPVDGVVTNDSVNKVIKTSVYNKIDEDYELITVIPIDFIIDSVEGNSNPVGIECSKLGIKGIMITVPKKNIYSVIGIIEGAGLDVVDITISGLADYHEIRNKKLNNKVGAIINLGHETTNVSIISDGILVNTETIQLGGMNIEKDIAYVFGTNIIDARKIKERFSSCHKRFTNLNDTYELKNDMGEIVKLNQLEVTEVVMSRMVEILEYAKKQIFLLTKKEIQYIIITGGLTEIKSFKNLVYEILGKDVIIYLMDEIGIRDNKYTTSLGMIKYYVDKMTVRGKESSMISQEDEELLLTPDDKKRKEKAVVTKIFKGFIRNKEEK